jgi:hypothetical protein
MAKRLNPVEFVIFGLVATGFGLSGYRLLNEGDSLQLGQSALLTPMSSSPISESRAPASAPLFSQIAFDCGSRKELSVSASKVRINGPLCGLQGQDPTAPSKAVIINSTNHFSATVFTDSKKGQFSTDYIPLSPEKNTIQIEFSYENGKSVLHELTLIKN